MSNLGALRAHPVASDIHIGIGTAEHITTLSHRKIASSFRHKPSQQPLRLKEIIVLLILLTGLSAATVGWLTYYERRANLSANTSILPAVSLNPAASRAHLIDRIESQKVSIDVGGQITVLKATDIASLITTDPSGKVTVNTDAVNSYVTKLAAAASVIPISQINVRHSDGTTSVEVSGVNGFKPGDISQAVSQLDQQLPLAKGVSVKLPGAVTPFQTFTVSEYAKLLDVDLTDKRMYAYEGSTRVKTFLVTAGAPATPTPVGQFKIWEKLPIQTMRGYNPNGTKYVQPDVKWINYFDKSGDAVHGNYWRPASVFGNTNTSHGCVSVVESEAKWIYDWAPIGTTVLNHY